MKIYQVRLIEKTTNLFWGYWVVGTLHPTGYRNGLSLHDACLIAHRHNTQHSSSVYRAEVVQKY